jgi:putative two-component system protein, hydrogenase maturation factor HypX/HoxX
VALGRHAANLPWSPLPIDDRADHRTFQEIRYVEEQGVGRLFFDFHNGAMSTDQCYRLRDAFLFARGQPTHVIELRGGLDFFSNGIHLNVIEAAADPSLGSWRNINAIDDLVLEILDTMSHLVVAGLCGNAGAGGAMLALAADYVYARDGVVLNPHYTRMGLYGSEYWTYTLPRRVGAAQAIAITEGCRPMGTGEAKATGLIDDCFGSDAADFGRILAQRSEQLSRREDFWHLLRKKHERRTADERAKPLACYRAEELTRMRENFYGRDPAYHAARQQFVYKGQIIPTLKTTTPEARLAWSSAPLLSAYLSVCMVIYSTGNPVIGFAIALLLHVVFTLLSGWIAARRGRSTMLRYWLGAILGPIALLAIALLPPIPTTPGSQTR